MAKLNTRPMIAGAAVGAVAAIALILLPSTALESIVSRTHLGDVFSAAQPPLGAKARVLIALIPFLLFSVTGIVLGFVLGGRKRKDDYGDYGAYSDYDVGDDRSDADPFATPDLPIMAGTYEEPLVEAPAEPVAAAPVEPPAPQFAPPAPAPQPGPALDGTIAHDLAEIADAVVRLDARLDSIEAKIGSSAPAAKSTDLSKRLAKIAKALDDAG